MHHQVLPSATDCHSGNNNSMYSALSRYIVHVTNSFFSSFAFSFVITLSILSLSMTLFFFVNGYCNRLLILFTLCITHHSYDSSSCGPTVPFLISPFVTLYHYVVYAYDSSL